VIAGAIGKSSAAAGVVIFGGLGVGKSRLAHDAASRCDGTVVRWAAGSSAARAIPLGAFVKWLPVDVFEPVQATGRVVNELIRDSDPRACIVAVDDVHLLDDTSTFMLHRLIDRSQDACCANRRRQNQHPLGLLTACVQRLHFTLSSKWARPPQARGGLPRLVTADERAAASKPLSS